ncbi:MAG: hypothetical protein HRT68_04835 [Flavobacteriaceae bacterium]|nr:hypothetical protein [Flavobacteriaceae bacterium]
MNLNFKTLACVLLCLQLALAQEKEEGKTPGKEAFSGIYLETGYAQPIFYGNNFINKGYDLSGTFDFGFNAVFLSNATFHFDVNVNSADVERPDLVGNIRSSVFTRISAGGGYLLYAKNKLSFIPSLHIGYLKIGQKFADEKFRDDGFFITAEIALSYRIFDWIDITAGAKNYFDFLNIEAPSGLKSFFNNAQSVHPYVGLRFRIIE